MPSKSAGTGAIHDRAIYIKDAILAFLAVMALAYADLSLFRYFEPITLPVVSALQPLGVLLFWPETVDSGSRADYPSRTPMLLCGGLVKCVSI